MIIVKSLQKYELNSFNMVMAEKGKDKRKISKIR